jgi:hypothetical protein
MTKNKKYIIYFSFIVIAIIVAIVIIKPSGGVTKKSIVNKRMSSSKENLEKIFQYISVYKEEHDGTFPHGNSSEEVLFLILHDSDITEKIFINPLLDIGEPKIEKGKINNCGYIFNLKLAGSKYNGMPVPLVYSQIDAVNGIPGLILFTDGTVKEFNEEHIFNNLITQLCNGCKSTSSYK